MLKNADNVKQKTTTTGTGSYVFSSDVTGYFRFDDAANGVGVNNSCIYAVRMGANFEVAKGTVAADGLSITRDEVIESSNGGSLVNWSAGEKDIYVTLSAKRPYLESLNHGPLGGFRNRLKNGGFRYKNVGLATTPDGCYGIDGWYALTQANPIAIARQSAPEAGATHGVRLTQSNASAQRIGLAQVISNERMADMAGKPCTLSGRVRTSAGNIMNFAVIEWTGTADAVTLDVVNDWTSGTFTTGNFFKATNFNAPVRGGISTVANTWQSFSLNYTPSASATNLIVLAWSNGALAQNATVDFNRMQFELGEAATVFERRVERLLPPIVIVASGQSNMALYPSYTWTPPENLEVWNNTRNSTAVGDAFGPCDGTVMHPAYSCAAACAADNPDRPVKLIVVGVGGLAISQWLDGATTDMFAAIKSNVEAALAVIGKSSLTDTVPFLWWQGESDAVLANANYVSNFATLHARFRAETWWPYELPIVMFGMSSLAGSTYANYNKYLLACAAAEPDTVMYSHTALLPTAYWDPSGAVPYIHGNAAGFYSGGLLAYNAFQANRRAVMPGATVDPATGNYMFGSGLVPGSSFFTVDKSQNAASNFDFENLNSGSSAFARLSAKSNAGYAALVAFSSGLGSAAGLHTSGLSTMQYICANHRFYNATPVSNHLIDANGVLQPASDNALSLGLSGKRWSTIYLATNPTVSSDARQKTNVETLDGELAWEFISRLRPVTFQWVSGHTIVTVEDDPDNMVEEPVLEDVTVLAYDVEVVDGKAIMRRIERIERREAFDLLPVFDEAGNPVTNEKGQVFHQQMKTRRVPGKKEVHTDRAGVRIHLGHIAQEIKALMDDLGVDWGLFVHDEGSDTYGLRPDQFAPVIVAAMQWKFAQVDLRLTAVET